MKRRLDEILDPEPSRLSRPVLAAVVMALLALVGISAWNWFDEPPVGSIAVIPFASVPASTEGVQMAEALSEGVINALILGDRERAMAELLEGYRARDPLLQFIRVESYFSTLMHDARFLEIGAGGRC